MDIKSLKEAYNVACADVQDRSSEWDSLADDADTEDVEEARSALADAITVADDLKTRIEDAEKIEAARAKFVPVELDKDDPVVTIEVEEPDMYVAGGKRNFLRDLYLSHLRNDPAASARLAKHQEFELSKMTEERAIATGTLGGAIPPQYLVSMYAKASRAGRVFADQCNRSDPLPDEGMSIIVPRITTPSAAGIQTSENTTLTTQDVAETDLTVNVRTIGGYLPVSRQTLERASYSEAILFEDLLARYWSKLDSQCLIGDGNSGAVLGVFHTSSVVSKSANSDGSVEMLWNKVADAKQTILTTWGGLGLYPEKIFMHPRRWGAISAYLDDNHRPLFGYNNAPVITAGTVGDGTNDTYGFVGYFQGLPVFIDANMPINLDTNTNRDAIVITSSGAGAPLLWERNDDPVTLAFEQQAGTSLQVQLIAYGYLAFTAGRYPDATAVIDDFPAPTFT